MAIYSGDIFAENYSVSSSVTNVQIAASSGSMKFGDSGDDTHQFTGSLFISGSRISIDDGNGNTTLGNLAGDALTTGGNNVAIGKSALGALTTGTNNVALGTSAMSSADGVERENIAIGYYAGGGVNNDSAIRNVFIGEYAGYGGTGAFGPVEAIKDLIIGLSLRVTLSETTTV